MRVSKSLSTASLAGTIPVLCFPCLVWTLVHSCSVPCFVVFLIDESPQVFLISPIPLLSCLACLSVYLNLYASVVGCRLLLLVAVSMFLS